MPRRQAEPGAEMIEVEIDGVTVRVGRGADAKTVTAVLRALKDGTCRPDRRGPRDGGDQTCRLPQGCRATSSVGARDDGGGSDLGGGLRVQCEARRPDQAGVHALSRWEGLTRFIGDGRIELDNNTVERYIRPIALNRKNALFAGSDGGAEHWATVASLIETCKLNDIDPLAYLIDVLTRIPRYQSVVAVGL